MRGAGAAVRNVAVKPGHGTCLVAAIELAQSLLLAGPIRVVDPAEHPFACALSAKGTQELLRLHLTC